LRREVPERNRWKKNFLAFYKVSPNAWKRMPNWNSKLQAVPKRGERSFEECEDKYAFKKRIKGGTDNSNETTVALYSQP
jgi:hypothetical protein